jgi:radial spoke head protein 3
MEFQQPPQAVAHGKPGRTKYRENGKSGGNLMYDRRVMRGNTYGGIVVPPSGGRNGSGSGGARRKKKFIPPASDSIFNIRPEVERREGIDLSQYLISKEDARGGDTRVEVHVESQTDAFDELPPPAPYIPKKTGVDVSTQIEVQDNLFKFDLEVAPILEVLVGKTLEQSLLEVQEEEELLNLKERKEKLQQDKREEVERMNAMEKAEQKKWEEKETYRLAERDRVEREQVLEQKVWASYMSKTLVDTPFVNNLFTELERKGIFKDPVRRSVEEQFMPWVLDAVGGQLNNVVMSRRLVDSALRRTLGSTTETDAQKREREQEEYAETSTAKFQDAEVSGLFFWSINIDACCCLLFVMFIISHVVFFSFLNFFFCRHVKALFVLWWKDLALVKLDQYQFKLVIQLHKSKPKYKHGLLKMLAILHHQKVES